MFLHVLDLINKLIKKYSVCFHESSTENQKHEKEKVLNNQAYR